MWQAYGGAGREESAPALDAPTLFCEVGQMTDRTNRLRRSARIILLDAVGRVLLLRFVIDRSSGPYLFWATPGGEVEPGEELLAAAQRELHEEIGLSLPLIGPVHHASGVFEFRHEVVDNVDAFYLAHFAGGTITLGGVDDAERSVLRELRWWTADEIEASPDPVYPPDLAAVVRRLGAVGRGSDQVS
jgi:8-oxo-dGTP pyrophosphatase MutT (NUDIX family)